MPAAEPMADRHCADEETRKRQQAASKTLDRLLAIEAALRDEINRLRAKGKRGATFIHFIHFNQADRLKEILEQAAKGKGGGKQ